VGQSSLTFLVPTKIDHIPAHLNHDQTPHKKRTGRASNMRDCSSSVNSLTRSRGSFSALFYSLHGIAMGIHAAASSGAMA